MANANQSSPSPYMTSRAVCRLFGIDRRRLWAWVHRGLFPRADLVPGPGCPGFWLRATVDRWIREHGGTAMPDASESDGGRV